MDYRKLISIFIVVSLLSMYNNMILFAVDYRNSDLAFSRKIFINTTQSGVYIDEDIINFPILIRLNESNFNFNDAKEDGSDIRFRDIDGSELKYEIEYWNKKENNAQIWVLVPKIRKNDDEQYIKILWGNKTYINNSNGENVFEVKNNFVGVWHLDESNELYKDSTSNRLNLTGDKMILESEISSIIGKGQEFVGNNYIKSLDYEALQLKGDMTISFWMNTNEISKDWVRLVGKGDVKRRNYGIWLNRNSKKLLFQQYDKNGKAVLNLTSTYSTELNKWHFITVRIKDKKASIYIDGTECGISNISREPAVSDDPMTISYAGFHTYYKGIIDEVRISDFSRDENWIRLEYENQKENQSLLEFEVLPQIIGSKLSSDNSYIDIEFNQGVYSDKKLKKGLEKKDFDMEFIQNGGDCRNVSIDEITNINNKELSGGENTVRVHLNIENYPSGVETIKINAVENSIFNEVVVPVESSEGTENINLNLQVKDIIIDNSDSNFAVNGDKWTLSSIIKGYYGENYIHDGTSTNDGMDSWAKWMPNIIKEGRYKVYMRWTSNPNRPDNAEVEIGFNAGADIVNINQKKNGDKWNLLGTYSFDISDKNYIKLNTSDEGYTIADAIRLEYVGSSYNKWKYGTDIYLDTTDKGADVKEDVLNFPVLIELNNENFNFEQSNLNGEDIRFSSNEGNELEYEIEYWDYSKKSASIWVMIPKIYGDDNKQSIKMYWGNNSVNDSSKGDNVFDQNNGFEGVWHLSEDGNSDKGGYFESVYGKNATGININGQNDITGISGMSQNLDGKEDYIEVDDSDIYKITGDMTISFWMKTNSNARDWVRLVGKGNKKYRNYGVWLNSRDNRILFQQYNNKGSAVLNLYSENSVNNSEWTYVTCTVNKNTAKIYINGVSDSNGKRKETPGTSVDNLTFGYAGYHTFYNGTLDEIRISKIQRNSDWIKLEYENQKENQSLVNFPEKPIIKDYKLAGNNSYVELYFNRGVYGDSNAKTSVNISDFDLVFHQNGGSKINIELSEVTDKADSNLIGGENTIRAYMNIYNTPTGVEAVEIKSRGSNSIFNDYGLAMDWGQTTGEIKLNVIKSSTIIIDNEDINFSSSGKWTESKVVSGFYGENYLHDSNGGSNLDSVWAKWTPDIIYSGEYEVYMRWSSDRNRPDNAPLEIKYKDGVDKSRKVNQKMNGGKWNHIGKYSFNKGTDGYIKVLTSDVGYTIADSVKLVYLGSSYEDWKYNTKVYMDTSSKGADINEDIEDFPALIELNEENFSFSKAKENGDDIRFSDSSGISLKYEIEDWNFIKKKAKIWVNISYIKGNNKSQFIRMFWGKDNAESESDGSSVFDKELNYQGVWHLNEDGNSSNEGYKDSSINRNNLTGISMNSDSDIEGIISKGQKFDGSVDYIKGESNDSLKIKGDITVSFWMNTDSMSNDWVRLVGKGNRSYRNYGIWLNRSNKKILFQQYSPKGSMSFYSKSSTSTGNWHYITTTLVNDVAKIYIDGKLDSTSKRRGIPYISDDYFSLSYAGYHTYYNGSLDEVRILDMGKSDDWIKMEYENQKENQTLIKIEKRPSIVSYDLAYDNEYVDLTFNQGIYSTSVMDKGIELNDFEIIENNKDLNVKIKALKNSENKNLTGGERKIRFYLNLEGEIKEGDKFYIKPIDDNSVFNEEGLSMLDEESSEDIILNFIGDKSNFDDWKYNTKIILDTTSNGADIKNNVESIPILVELNEDNFDLDLCKEKGDDIRFSNSLGMELNYEIEKWDNKNKKAYLWVFMPNVKGNNSSQFIKMHWGNEDADSKSDGKNVFITNKGFEGVWHLNESEEGIGEKSIYKDSTKNGFHLDDYIENNTNNGFIGNGLSMTGNDYLRGNSSYFSFDSNSTFTFYSWIKPRSSNDSILISKIKNDNKNKGWKIYFDRVFGVEFVSNKRNLLSKESNEKLFQNKWNQIAVTYDGSKSAINGCELYLNGIKQSAEINNDSLFGSIENKGDFIVGGSDLGDFYKGDMDEIQISNEVKTDDFIRLSYENQKENQTFVNVMPTVVSVESSTKNGIYGIGDSINLNVVLSGKVKVNLKDELPYITVNSNENAKAIYKSKDEKKLNFIYDVNEGDFTKDFDYENKFLLSNEEGIFESLNGFNVDLIKPESEGLSNKKDIIIDGIRPVIENVIINKGDDVKDTKIYISLNASDSETDLAYMSISEGKEVFDNWDLFNENSYFEVSKGDGIKNLYVKVKDKADNISLVYIKNINLNTKFFKALGHNVRTKDDNIFDVGGIVPVSIRVKFESAVQNPTFSIYLNTRDVNENKLGFYLMPYLLNSGEIDKSRIKVFKSDKVLDSNMVTTNNKEEFLNSKRFIITVNDNFSKGEILEIQYLTKLNADSKVWKSGIYSYLKDNKILSENIYIDFEISKWLFDGNKIGNNYNKSVNILEKDEKDKFSASIIVQPSEIIK